MFLSHLKQIFFTLLWVILGVFSVLKANLKKWLLKFWCFFIACAICPLMGRVFLQFSCMNFGVNLQRETVK